MVNMGNKTALLLITALLTFPLYSQENKQLQNTFLEAEYFFMNEDYSDAINYYLQIYSELPDNANIALRIGVCYLNMPGKKDISLKYLEAAIKNMSAKHKEGTLKQITAPYDALYELAKAYRINYNFDKAKEMYLRYREILLPDDRENIEFIDHEIKVCDMAKTLISNPVTFSEENMGELFNDDKPNFNPVISADGKSFAFMSSLKFYDAIMYTRMFNGKWAGPVNIYAELQIDGDINISSLSKEGRLLFLSRDDNNNSDIYSSAFDGTVWSPVTKLNKNINTKYWESHAFISEDGNQLIFASDRPGGYGGLDLYISLKTNGDWGPPVNMGSEINTQFNEDRPFFTNRDKILIFCSQGHENMGGYDLFKSELQPNSSWKRPENIGYPLNTPDDNTYFMPSGDGKSGYLFLNKEGEGFGKEDIYRIILK
jgi:tetratricopeptide (TPR) repeat protein